MVGRKRRGRENRTTNGRKRDDEGNRPSAALVRRAFLWAESGRCNSHATRHSSRHSTGWRFRSSPISSTTSTLDVTSFFPDRPRLYSNLPLSLFFLKVCNVAGGEAVRDLWIIVIEFHLFLSARVRASNIVDQTTARAGTSRRPDYCCQPTSSCL